MVVPFVIETFSYLFVPSVRATNRQKFRAIAASYSASVCPIKRVIDFMQASHPASPTHASSPPTPTYLTYPSYWIRVALYRHARFMESVLFCFLPLK